MSDQDRRSAKPERASPFREPQENAVERAIREAQERGAFDDLPHRGRPLPLPDERYATDMALAFQVLRSAGFAPPWIEADKDVRRQLEERDRLLAWAERAGPLAQGTIRQRLRATVEAANQAIAALNAMAPTPRQQRRPLRLEEEQAELERRFEATE